MVTHHRSYVYGINMVDFINHLKQFSAGLQPTVNHSCFQAVNRNDLIWPWHNVLISYDKYRLLIWIKRSFKPSNIILAGFFCSFGLNASTPLCISIVLFCSPYKIKISEHYRCTLSLVHSLTTNETAFIIYYGKYFFFPWMYDVTKVKLLNSRFVSSYFSMIKIP